MPGIKAAGIILKQTEYGESNSMLSIFTKEYGIIRAAVYGVKSIKSGKGAACQILSFSEFELSKGSTDIYTVCAASPIKNFYPLAEDIAKFSLAAYLCDITYNAVGFNNPEEGVLKLLLNTFYAVCYNGVALRKAKCVYEMRMMSLLGYRPVLTKCVKCGNIKKITGFSAKNGGLVCADCAQGSIGIGKPVAEALNYIISAEDKKMFSFTMKEEHFSALEKICEEYVKVQLDMEVPSLLYFKKMVF